MCVVYLCLCTIQNLIFFVFHITFLSLFCSLVELTQKIFGKNDGIPKHFFYWFSICNVCICINAYLHIQCCYMVLSIIADNGLSRIFVGMFYILTISISSTITYEFYLFIQPCMCTINRQWSCHLLSEMFLFTLLYFQYPVDGFQCYFNLVITKKIHISSYYLAILLC